MKSYNLKSVLINGSVCYKDGCPIKNVIVFLEVYVPYKYHGTSIKYCRKYCGSTITNFNGKFHFLIYDTRFYYKIKVFNNAYMNKHSINCCINLDQYIGDDLW